MSKSKVVDGTDFERLFHPRAIGIVGASLRPSGGGHFLISMEGRFKGEIYLFNPRLKGKKLFGHEVHGSILEIPDDKPIDYVILGVQARLCPKLMEEVGKKKVPFVTIFASGFSEIDDTGKKLEQEVLDIAKKYNIRIIGPNCLGVYSPEAGLYIASGLSKKSGNFSGVFQSGGLAQNISQLAVSYGCFISKLISIGNSIDLTHPDFLRYFLRDDHTKIIGLYLENLKSIEIGREFMDAAKECNLNRKPVILWRAGYGEATKKAIMSHTGGLAGNNAIWKAVAKQTGCSLVSSSAELATLASGFKLIHLPASRKIGLIGIGGGSTIEAADILEKYGLKIPKLTEKTITKMGRFLKDVNTNFNNPIDLGAQGALPNVYYRTILALENDPNIDSIVFVKDPERFAKLEDTIIRGLGYSKSLDLNKSFIQYISKAKRQCNKPMVCVMLKINEGFEEYKSRYKFKLKLLNRNVPVFENFDLAGSVLNHMNNYREFLQKHGKYPKN